MSCTELKHEGVLTIVNTPEISSEICMVFNAGYGVPTTLILDIDT